MAASFYTSMSPSAQDPIQMLLAKACYHAQVAAEALGGPFMAGFYENMSPGAQDPIQMLAAKLAYWAAQIAAGGGGGSAFDWITWEDTGPTPAGPPSDPTKAGMVRFRDGSPPVVYDPTIPGWV